MPDGDPSLSVHMVERLADIGQAAWDACAGPENPFVSYDFLSSLEDSGCVGPAQTGWLPRHLVLKDQGGHTIACAPAYLKTHSFGEYVFDWGWAEAYERAGGRYYPKLLVGVPFTPATGPRLLVRPDRPQDVRQAARRSLAQGLRAFALNANLSSAHVNFASDTDLDVLRETGFKIREGLQYHWKNNDYESFDDFLDELSSRKRKTLKRERRDVLKQNLKIERLTGDAVTEAHWDALFRFYQHTGARKWGRPYLNRDFFSLLGERMKDRVLLVMASRDGRPIAGALNLIGVNALYGRYWGAIENVPFLHFELCYHQAIEAAIERGLERVEAGAQGEHKISRGYLPAITRSAHWIQDPALKDAVERFIDGETRAVRHEMAALMDDSPYRQDGRNG